MRVPLVYEKDPVFVLSMESIYLWRGSERPSHALSNQNWVSVTINRIYFGEEKRIRFYHQTWEPNYVGRLDSYFLTEIPDEVLLTSDDDTLRNWALEQLTKKEHHVHSA